MQNLKLIIITPLLVIISFSALSKEVTGCKDRNGNPVLRSIFLEEKNQKKYDLIANYFTLRNNITSSVSSAYISDRPSLDEIEKTALSLQSENFILTKNGGHVVALFLVDHQKKTFLVIKPASGYEANFATNLEGDISENRAQEIIKEKYDPNAKIEKGILNFNGHAHKIIPYHNIKKALLQLVEKEKIDEAVASNAIILSQVDLAKMIIKDSQKGGKLDVFTEIEGHEFDGIKLDDVYVTFQSASLYKWGLAVHIAGVASEDKAIKIFEKFKGRKLKDGERFYIKKGYEDYILKNLECKNPNDVNTSKTQKTSPLFASARDGDLKLVKSLLVNKTDLDKIENDGKDGATPLYIAVDNNHLEVVKALIDAKADVNKTNAFNTTPLIVSAYKGYADIAKILIEAGADINKATNSGATPLFLAAQNGYLEIVKLLIEAKADINKSEINSNASPLLVAAQNGHLEVVKLLIQAGSDLNKVESVDGRTPIYVAAEKGYVEVVKTLISAGADIDKATKYGVTPLFIAAQNGYLKEVKVLIEAKANVDLATVNNATPIYIAAQHGHLKIVNALIEAGADIHKSRKDGTNPVFIAASRNYKDIVKSLIKAKASFDQPTITDGSTALVVAAKEGYLDIAKILLEAGANPNHITNTGVTPLFAAVYSNHEKVVRILIENRANPYLKTSVGTSYEFAQKNPNLQREIEELWKKYEAKK